MKTLGLGEAERHSLLLKVSSMRLGELPQDLQDPHDPLLEGLIKPAETEPVVAAGNNGPSVLCLLVPFPMGAVLPTDSGLAPSLALGNVTAANQT